MKPKNHYIDNKVLYTEMIKYISKLSSAKEEGLPKSQYPRVPEYIGVAIYKIATKLATKPNFSGYSYKEEMISDGIENCLMYLHNFNPDKSKNPFAYFTTIIYYAFLRRIQKEQKQQYIKQKSLINSSIMNTLVDQSEDSNHFNAAYVHLNDDRSNDLIKKFEKNKPIKEKKKKGIENFLGESDDEI
jgi:DNA-directed RNA polymerase specialized sigma24 family protein